MKLNAVTITGSVVLGITGFWVLVGAGTQQHYDPGKGSITSNKDVGYFLGVEAGRMGNAIGNVFFAEELTEKGAIATPTPINPGSFCYPWNNHCKEQERHYKEYQQSQEQLKQRRSY